MKKNLFKNYLEKEGGLGQTGQQFDYLSLGLKGLGKLYGFIVNGSDLAKPVSDAHGKTENGIHMATSEQIGKILRIYGGKPGKINLGAYVPQTDEIFVNPDSWKYGHDPREVLGHEIGHRNGITDERAADEYGSRWVRELLQAA